MTLRGKKVKKTVFRNKKQHFNQTPSATSSLDGRNTFFPPLWCTDRNPPAAAAAAPPPTLLNPFFSLPPTQSDPVQFLFLKICYFRTTEIF